VTVVSRQFYNDGRFFDHIEMVAQDHQNRTAKFRLNANAGRKIPTMNQMAMKTATIRLLYFPFMMSRIRRARTRSSCRR
jgi:hypothetical protein